MRKTLLRDGLEVLKADNEEQALAVFGLSDIPACRCADVASSASGLTLFQGRLLAQHCGIAS